MIRSTLPRLLEIFLSILIGVEGIYFYIIRSRSEIIEDRVLIKKGEVRRPLPNFLESLGVLEKLYLNFNVQKTVIPSSNGLETQVTLEGSEKVLKKIWEEFLTQNFPWQLQKFKLMKNQLQLFLKIKAPENETIKGVNWQRNWFKQVFISWELFQMVYLTHFKDQGKIYAVIRAPDGKIFNLTRGDILSSCRITRITQQKIFCSDQRYLERSP